MKRLILLGGGHAHVHVLATLARQAPEDCEILLISPFPRQIYSGMLPGWIAGHYGIGQCTIPLDVLAQRAHCRFLQAAGRSVHPESREVECADGSRWSYDLLSVDVGPASRAEDFSASPGLLAVRPLEAFVQGWEDIVRQAREANRALLAVIGGGAGGVELALAMHHRLVKEIGDAGVSVTLISAGPGLLPGHPAGVGRRLQKLMEQRDIRLVFNDRAVGADASGVLLESGRAIPAVNLIVATGAAAPDWAAATGLALDAEGFIRIDPTLRSVSHPDIFAAGDVAGMEGHPRPKSGVYAVRAGPPLAENLRRALAGEPLLRYLPQRRALYLISTGDRHAVASWGPFSWAGRWVWRWKDRIDRDFIARYQ